MVLVVYLLIYVTSLFTSERLHTEVLLITMDFTLSILFCNVCALAILGPVRGTSNRRYFFSNGVTRARLSSHNRIVLGNCVEKQGIGTVTCINVNRNSVNSEIDFSTGMSGLRSRNVFSRQDCCLPSNVCLDLSPASPVRVAGTASLALSRELVLCSERYSLGMHRLTNNRRNSFVATVSANGSGDLSPTLGEDLGHMNVNRMADISNLRVSIMTTLILFLFGGLELGRSVYTLDTVVPVTTCIICSKKTISTIHSTIVVYVCVITALFVGETRQLGALSLYTLLVILPGPCLTTSSSFVLSLDNVFTMNITTPGVYSTLGVESKVLSTIVASYAT